MVGDKIASCDIVEDALRVVDTGCVAGEFAQHLRFENQVPLLLLYTIPLKCAAGVLVANRYDAQVTRITVVFIYSQQASLFNTATKL